MVFRLRVSLPAGFLLRLFLGLTLMSCVLVPSLASASPADDLSKQRGSGIKVVMPEHKPDEIIVIWKETASGAERAGARSLADIDGVLSTVRNRQLLKLKPGVTVEGALESLKNNHAIEAAGLNRLRHLYYIPSSPSFSKQWGLNNTGQTIGGQPGTPDADIDAVEAWDLEQGNSNETIVAVIDSGIDLDHPNLSGRLWTNASDPVNGIDDDGNGYIDDSHGYNWAGISQYRMTTGWSFGADSNSQYVAQQFTAQGINGQCRIEGLEMFVYGKIGSPTQTITYAIRSSLTGENIVETNPITADRIDASGSFVYEPFTSVVNLTPGNTYFFVAFTSSIDPENFYIIVDHVASSDSGWDSYVEGTEWWKLGEDWQEFSSDDFYFKSNGYYFNRDNNGHGTHCCGIVGAADSGSGSIGVAFGNATRLMALKAGDSSGSLWSSDWMDAIDYARRMGADIISMSFGGTGSDEAEQAVIDNAYNNGLVLFASSGNSSDSTMQYPVGYNNVIGVGATNNQDTIASFSTHNSSVDVSAPGVGYYSTMPTYPVAENFWGYTQSYSYMSGTSMACPVAAGLGALLRSKAPFLTPAQVQTLMETNADDKGTPGRDDYYGYGRINAYNALAALDGGTCPVRIPGTPALCFDYIQSAYDSAVNGDFIQLLAYDFPEDLVFDRSIGVTLEGGYDSLFETVIGRSRIRGRLVIKSGSLIMKGITMGTGP